MLSPFLYGHFRRPFFLENISNLRQANYSQYPVCLQPGEQLSPRDRSVRLRQMAQLQPCQAVYESAYNQCIETLGG